MSEDAEQIVAAQIAQARLSFPQYSAASDLLVVAMLASNRAHAMRERNEALNCNARQAQMIAQLTRELDAWKAAHD